MEAKFYQADLMEMPTRKLLNLAYAWLLEGCKDQGDIDRLDFELSMPLPGEEQAKVTHSDLESDAASFLALHQGR